MISYIVINVLISFWALSINRWMQIPERHKFPILLFALLSWTLPYHLVSFGNSLQVINETVSTAQSFTGYNAVGQTVNTWMPTLIELGLFLMLFGLLLFAIDVIQLIKKHKALTQHGMPTSLKNVWLVNDLNGACVSGFWQPKIWIDKDLFEQAELTAVLAHEHQHIKNGDIYWILIIGLVQRIFWFNPVVYLLNKKLREVIELRCDEACQKHQKNNDYQKQLAKILLTYQQSKPTSLLNEIAQQKSFQIKRIQQLSQEKNMKNINKLQITLSLFAILMISTLALAAQDGLKSSVLNDNEVLVNIDFKVTEQFSGIKESASAKRQMAIQFDEWQEVELDKYFIKYKVTEIPADENESQKLFLIETEFLNSDKEKFENAASVVKANMVFAMKIIGHTINEPEFNLSFEILTK